MHMHLPMHISAATEADIPVLCELLRELFTHESEFTPNADTQHRGLARIIANPQAGTILMAHDHDAVVGMVNLLFTESTALGSRVAVLEDMVVFPESRGKGIGTMLLQAAFQVARVEGCKRITLLTEGRNAAAQRFYARHGFGRSPMIPMRVQFD
jgi:GNAT superfamily N-acetyltransferase